jgi:tetratricopeptide (TPR) repeat protein
LLPLPEPAALLTTAAIRLKEQRHFLSAYTAAKRAEALAPNHPVPKATIGAILWNMSRFEEGEALLKQAIAQVPDSSEYWAHLALCQSSQRKDAEAKASYARATEIAPNDLAILWNKSSFLLSAGDWEQGLIDYESRVEYRGRPAYPKLPYPLWEGEDLNGKTLVIQGEQGVGDTLLSSRYIPLIKAKWPQAKLIWFVQPKLHDLLWEYHDYIEFYPPGYPWPKAEFGVFQMSLLRLFGARPDNIAPDPGLLRKRAKRQSDSVQLPAPHVPSLKIGISWTGNPDMMANEVRSVPLEMLMPLAEDPRFTFYSLQVGEAAQHIQFGGCGDLIADCSADLAGAGFSGTAAMMMNLDLILTVCTSNAHLAGALGVPCWTMLSHDCYWVWGREGDSTPWYPGMKLFRQRKTDEWQPVIDDVKAALEQLVSARALAA